MEEREKKNEGERKEMEVVVGLVAGGEVLQRGGMEMRGRPASSGMSAARGGRIIWRHEGGGAHA